MVDPKQIASGAVSRFVASDRYAYQHLDEVQLDWLRAQPASYVLDDTMLMFHGAPGDDRTYLMTPILHCASCGEMLRGKSSNFGAERTLSTTTESVDEYRVKAPEVIKRMAIVTNLLNALPDEGQGSKDLLTKQIATSFNAWVSALDLEPSMKDDVYNKFKTAVENAIRSTQEDFSEAGFLQIETITQNKVM
ncbi:MAG: hypothetical protein HGA71_20760 [Azonexaceae bacterium]|nr:hypothetical protein [Azonexaceae bacterium]